MSLGLYISVPFCRSKCTYCNFASGVFSPGVYPEYVELLRQEIRQTLAWTAHQRIALDAVDSVYFGGGTPTVLSPALVRAIGEELQAHFLWEREVEFTVEAAPGTLDPATLDAFQELGMNRVSLGVQSFVERETRFTGRAYGPAQVASDLQLLRSRGIDNISIDLIAGLAHQDEESWRSSLQGVAEAGVPHASVYMLEIDEDSRLGNELIAGGRRYHAHHVPCEELVVQFYEQACAFLACQGLRQYEISNFAQPGRESLHNERYWRRAPYLGFGLEAHSMLLERTAENAREQDGKRASGTFTGEALEWRWGNSSDLEHYIAALRNDEPAHSGIEQITPVQQLEESLFLGLRRNAGVDLGELSREFGALAVAPLAKRVDELRDAELVTLTGAQLQLTSRGRLLSNEVFERLLLS